MTGLHGKSNGDVGAQVYLLEGHELEICGGGGAGHLEPLLPEGEILFLLGLFVTKSGTERQILLTKILILITG